jgi:hypothetical protein
MSRPAVIFAGLLLVSCGADTAGSSPAPSSAAMGGAESASSLPRVAPSSPAIAAAQTTVPPPRTRTAPVTIEPPAKGRPIIVDQDDPVRVELPAGPNGQSSSMTISVVALADEDAPFLQIETQSAFTAGKVPLWMFTIDGGRLSKFSANTGGTYGIRLSNEYVTNGFTLAIWSEEMDGVRISEPVQVSIEGASAQ